MLGISLGYLENILGYLGDILGISLGYLWDILGISWGYLADILVHLSICPLEHWSIKALVHWSPELLQSFFIELAVVTPVERQTFVSAVPTDGKSKIGLISFQNIRSMCSQMDKM